MSHRADPTPAPYATHRMNWYAVDRIELAERLRIRADLRHHDKAANALESYMSEQRGGGDIIDMMRLEGRYRDLPEEGVRAEAGVWLEAQWEVLMVDVAGERRVYSDPWGHSEWERVATDLGRALGLPFLRDAARRGLFGFRPRRSLIGFLTLREVREVLRSWPNVDPLRFRGTSLRLSVLEQIQEGLRGASEHEHEMTMLLT